MCRLEQLFIEDKFDPEDDKPLAELLATPLNKEVGNPVINLLKFVLAQLLLLLLLDSVVDWSSVVSWRWPSLSTGMGFKKLVFLMAILLAYLRTKWLV